MVWIRSSILPAFLVFSLVTPWSFPPGESLIQMTTDFRLISFGRFLILAYAKNIKDMVNVILWRALIVKRIARAGCLLVAFFFVGCGSNNTGTVEFQAGGVRNLALSNAISGLRYSEIKTERPSKIGLVAPLSSAGAVSWAHLDGLKLKMKKVRIFGPNSDAVLLDSAGQEIDIVSASVQNPAISAEVPVGTYTNVEFSAENSYSLKAWGVTANQFCYTVNGGICDAGGVVCQAASTVSDESTYTPTAADYGYCSYSFLQTSATGSNDSSFDQIANKVASIQDSNEPIYPSLTVEGGDEINMRLLFNTNYFIKLMDNTIVATGDSANMTRETPFQYSNWGAHGWFQPATSNFGGQYITVHVAVENKTAKAAGRVETGNTEVDSTVGTGIAEEIYVISDDASATCLSSAFSYSSDCTYLSLAYRVSGEKNFLNSARTNEVLTLLHDDRWTFKSQYFSRFSNLGSIAVGSTFDMYNGEINISSTQWNSDDGSNCTGFDYGAIRQRKITGFTRLALDGTGTATVSNGEDAHCYQGTEAYNQPLTGDVTIYYRRIK